MFRQNDHHQPKVLLVLDLHYAHKVSNKIHNQILDQSQEYSIALEVFVSAEYSRQSTGSQLDLEERRIPFILDVS
jgi:hypothetical protein